MVFLDRLFFSLCHSLDGTIIAGDAENAGVENVAPNCMAGKYMSIQSGCRSQGGGIYMSGKCGTKLQGYKNAEVSDMDSQTDKDRK